METQYRQGDVLLIEICEVPKGPHRPVRREDGRLVLAYGEATGHCHAIYEQEAEMVELESGERFIVSPAGIRLVHEEHAAIDVPAGTYKVLIQQEYSPQEIKHVAD